VFEKVLLAALWCKSGGSEILGRELLRNCWEDKQFHLLPAGFLVPDLSVKFLVTSAQSSDSVSFLSGMTGDTPTFPPWNIFVY
jgi:hypothetical protein